MPSLSGSTKAPLYAQFGVMRFGATRVGYHSAHVYLSIGGVQVAVGYSGAGRVLIDSLVITDLLNEQPNTCRWTQFGAKPTGGQEVVIALGSTTGRRIFAGHLIDVQQIYVVDKPANVQWQVSAVDYTWQLGFRKVTAFYAEQSATAIAQSLITTYAAANGFTAGGVSPNLPTVPGGITFTNEDLPQALSSLAARIGAYWYIDYGKVLYFFLTDPGQNPEDLTAAHPTLADFLFGVAQSQHVNRINVEGRGTALLGAVLTGDTKIPLVAVDMFEAVGEYAKISFQGAEGGAQHVTFSGVSVGGAGSIVGPGFAPTDPISALAKGGAGIESGDHDYAVVYVTASGKTLPSPLKRVTHGNLATPTQAPALVTVIDSPSTTAYAAGDSLTYKATFSGADGVADYTNSTAAGPVSAAVVATESSDPGTNAKTIRMRVRYAADTRVKWVHVWKSKNGAAYHLADVRANVPGNVVGFEFDDITASGAAVPSASPGMNQSTLPVVPIGPTGTTSREIHRTEAGGSQLKLQQTIANNTATSGVDDSTADASLGANAPTGDTSALAVDVVTGSNFYTTVTGFATNGAATVATSAAPVFSSATYNFVAADVGAYLYIKAGTNWLTGRYRIVSVAANAATLDRACASVASPTGATWGVDYSVLAAPRIAFTDLAISPTQVTQFTSAANPVGPNFVGNAIAIRDGVGFTIQRIIVTGITGGTIGVADRALGTLSSTGGIGNLGGASPATAITPGATSLLLANPAAFSTAGGWAVAGDQVIRYTGISGNSLTGIPASGIGSITASISFGATLTAAPMITGVPASGAGAILHDLTAGDEIYLVVQRNNTTAQATLAARLGGAGIIEDWIQDRRLSIAEATARGDAFLASRPLDETRASYTCRDLNTQSGKTITMNLVAPTDVTGVLKIQSVTISNFRPYATQRPTFTVQASAQRYSFEDLLRQRKG